jgi:hypothetical protein
MTWRLAGTRIGGAQVKPTPLAPRCPVITLGQLRAARERRLARETAARFTTPTGDRAA